MILGIIPEVILLSGIAFNPAGFAVLVGANGVAFLLGAG